jgi:hypothetical protein
LGASLCKAGLGASTAHGFQANEFGSFPAANTQWFALAAALVLWGSARLLESRGAEWRRPLLGLAWFCTAVGSVAWAFVVVTTWSLPGPKHYISTLPIVAEILPLPAGPMAPDDPKNQAVREGEVQLADFQIFRRCQADVCSVYPERAGAGATCGLVPLLESRGPLRLREDARHGLFFFDGVSQTEPAFSPTERAHEQPAQLAFRQRDLRCVWPTDIDLPDAVQPSLLRPIFSAVVLGIAAWSLLRVRNRRPARAIVASLLALAVTLPWIVRML